MDGFIGTCTATSMSRFVDNLNSDMIVGIGRYLEACTRQIHGSTNYEDYDLRLLRDDMRIHSIFSAQIT